MLDRVRHAAISDSARDPAQSQWAIAELDFLDATRAGGTERVHLSLRSELAASNGRRDSIVPNGLGELDARTQAFDRLRNGWPMPNGVALTVAPAARLAPRRDIAVEGELTASAVSGRPTHFRSRRLYARVTGANIGFRVGREEMRWGQSEFGPIFLSGNAAPFPAAVVGTDMPVVFPWWFRLAGPTHLELFVSDLGRDQDPAHTKLAGWKITLQPSRRFEVSVAVLAQQGGRGGPSATLLQRVIDLIPVIDALAPQRTDLAISNKFAGGDLRLRFPELSGLDLHYEMHFDDFDLRRFRSTVVDDMSHVTGIRLPLLLAIGELEMRAEFHNTGLRVYEHFQFRSGLTYRDRLLGSPLGPNAKATYLRLGLRTSPRSKWTLRLADELRDPSRYTSTFTGPFDQGFRLIRLSDDPDHRLRGVMVEGDHYVGDLRLVTNAGYSRIWRSGDADARSEWGVTIALERALR